MKNEDVQNGLEKVQINEDNLMCFLYKIRGVFVLLDFDLAKAYGYTTSNFNRQVKNNIKRFPNETFMFQLTREEVDLVKCNFCTSRNPNYFSSQNGGSRKLPYAFTEKGLYMLMTVLKGELATEQSITLVNAFHALKNYYVQTNNLISTSGIIDLIDRVNKNEQGLKEIKDDNENIKNQLVKVMDYFYDPSTYKHFLIMNKERVEADIAYKMIYGLAKYSLLIIDNYISEKTLELLKEVDPKVSIIVVSDNVNNMPTSVVDDYSRDTGRNISIIPTKRPFHDRYIFIDYYHKSERLYHSGASIKDAGNGICTLVEIEEHELYRPLYDEAVS